MPMNGSAYTKPDGVTLRYSEPATRDRWSSARALGRVAGSISVVYRHIRNPRIQPSLASRSRTAPSLMSACYVRWI